MNNKSDYRHEVKFITNISNYNELFGWIKKSSLVFKKSYPDRLVSNIYFDNYKYDALESNLSGISKRQKVRYRWYNSHLPSTGALEIKHKKNNLGWKDLFIVNNSPYKEGDSWHEIIKKIKQQIPTNAINYLNTYNQPVLFNNYHRQYLESRNKKIRLTIDLKQNFYQQRSLITPNFTRKKPCLNIMTVELKCSNQDRDIASDFLKTIPIRHSRYSKYVVGMI